MVIALTDLSGDCLGLLLERGRRVESETPLLVLSRCLNKGQVAGVQPISGKLNGGFVPLRCGLPAMGSDLRR